MPTLEASGFFPPPGARGRPGGVPPGSPRGPPSPSPRPGGRRKSLIFELPRGRGDPPPGQPPGQGSAPPDHRFGRLLEPPLGSGQPPWIRAQRSGSRRSAQWSFGPAAHTSLPQYRLKPAPEDADRRSSRGPLTPSRSRPRVLNLSHRSGVTLFTAALGASKIPGVFSSWRPPQQRNGPPDLAAHASPTGQAGVASNSLVVASLRTMHQQLLVARGSIAAIDLRWPLQLQRSSVGHAALRSARMSQPRRYATTLSSDEPNVGPSRHSPVAYQHSPPGRWVCRLRGREPWRYRVRRSPHRATA